MSSLKEVKARISSVKSTQKITSAMKMVASAKLRKAQYNIERFLPYERQLNEIMTNFLSADTSFSSPFAEVREVEEVAIVVISSNSSLCGAFNSNVIRLLDQTLTEYKHLPAEKIHIYPIGKKVEEAIKKENLQKAGSFIDLIDKPSFNQAKELADTLMADFLNKRIDRVVLLYNHFKSTASQELKKELFLPIDLSLSIPAEKGTSVDYIIEPDKATLLEQLLPKSLRSKFYSALLDSAAAEQAARTVAMQIATDNATDIIDELTILYNKQRQQSITSELLDIIGGAEAQK